MKTKKILILFILVISSIIFYNNIVSSQEFCSEINSYDSNTAGEFKASILNNNNWQEITKEYFPGQPSSYRYTTKTIALPTKTTKIRITHTANTDTANVDAILLNDNRPIKATDTTTNQPLNPEKLKDLDYDVIDALNRTIELEWNNPGTKLTISAVGENVNNIPLVMPTDGSFLSYKIEEPEEFTQYWHPASSHPDGLVYATFSVAKDSLKVWFDVTLDNTLDLGEDWAELRILTDQGIKSFRIDSKNTKWGTSDFEYTNKVTWQHKTNTFNIPLGEINAEQGDTISFQIAYYGTLTGGGGAVCGDGRCNGGETCETCSVDCGGSVPSCFENAGCDDGIPGTTCTCQNAGSNCNAYCECTAPSCPPGQEPDPVTGECRQSTGGGACTSCNCCAPCDCLTNQQTCFPGSDCGSGCNCANSASFSQSCTCGGGSPNCPGDADCTGRECGPAAVCPSVSCGTCSAGYHCVGNTCVCSNDCSPSGSTACVTSTSKKTCGNYDSDSCLEWSSVQACGAGQLCENNNCCNANTYCKDADGDGYGNPSVTQYTCTQPAGYVPNCQDCNDNNKAINPSATEVCDGQDNDCDAATDEGFTAPTITITKPTSAAYSIQGSNDFSAALSTNGCPLTSVQTATSQTALCAAATFSAYTGCSGTTCTVTKTFSNLPAGKNYLCVKATSQYINQQTTKDVNVNTCYLDSVSIANSASCSLGILPYCEVGEQVSTAATLRGACPSPTNIQIDATSQTATTCNIQYTTTPSGISFTCTSNSCTGSWTISQALCNKEFRTFTPTAGSAWLTAISTGTWLDPAETLTGSFIYAHLETPDEGTCNDGLENDGDGLIDSADPDCCEEKSFVKDGTDKTKVVTTCYPLLQNMEEASAHQQGFINSATLPPWQTGCNFDIDWNIGSKINYFNANLCPLASSQGANCVTCKTDNSIMWYQNDLPNSTQRFWLELTPPATDDAALYIVAPDGKESTINTLGAGGKETIKVDKSFAQSFGYNTYPLKGKWTFGISDIAINQPSSNIDLTVLAVCGNLICEAPYEDYNTCAYDCGCPAQTYYCPYTETCLGSIYDCPICGDGIKQNNEECEWTTFSKSSCTQADSTPGISQCTSPQNSPNSPSCFLSCIQGSLTCTIDGFCDTATGETYTNCPQDCHCGNTACDLNLGEDWQNCPSDCPSTCGNTACDTGETINNCYADCSCGDRICDPQVGEFDLVQGGTAFACPQDCGIPCDANDPTCEICNSKLVCGSGVCCSTEKDTCTLDCHCPNKICEATFNEDQTNCPEDCSTQSNACTTQLTCGDNTCCETEVKGAASECTQDCAQSSSSSLITGVGFDTATNNALVSDSSLLHIGELTLDSNFVALYSLSTLNSQGTALSALSDVEYYQDTTMFVLNKAPANLYQITKDTALLNTIDLAQLGIDSPVGIGYDTASTNLFIADDTTPTVYKIKSDGTQLLTTLQLQAKGITTPTGLATANQQLAITDKTTNSLYILTFGGVVMDTFSLANTGIKIPSDVAYIPSTDNYLISDLSSGRVYQLNILSDNSIEVVSIINADSLNSGGGSCGNNQCEVLFESIQTCPQDCGYTCGNSVCEYDRGEAASNCQQDCSCGPNSDGVRVCEPSIGEDAPQNPNYCPQDCSAGSCLDTNKDAIKDTCDCYNSKSCKDAGLQGAACTTDLDCKGTPPIVPKGVCDDIFCKDGICCEGELGTCLECQAGSCGDGICDYITRGENSYNCYIDCGNPNCQNPTVCEPGDSCYCKECSDPNNQGWTGTCLDGSSCNPDTYTCEGCSKGQLCELSHICIDSDDNAALDTCAYCGGIQGEGLFDDANSICTVYDPVSRTETPGWCTGKGECLPQQTDKTTPKPKGFVLGQIGYGTQCETDIAIKKAENWICDWCNSTTRNQGAACNLYDGAQGTCNTTAFKIEDQCQLSCYYHSECPVALPYCNTRFEGAAGTCESCAQAPDPTAFCIRKNNGYCNARTGACVGTRGEVLVVSINPSTLKEGRSAILTATVQNSGVNTFDAAVNIDEKNCNLEVSSIDPKVFRLVPGEQKQLRFYVVPAAPQSCNIQVELLDQTLRCVYDYECTPSSQVCDTKSHLCVDCLTNQDCQAKGKTTCDQLTNTCS